MTRLPDPGEGVRTKTSPRSQLTCGACKKQKQRAGGETKEGKLLPAQLLRVSVTPASLTVSEEDTNPRTSHRSAELGQRPADPLQILVTTAGQFFESTNGQNMEDFYVVSEQNVIDYKLENTL